MTNANASKRSEISAAVTAKRDALRVLFRFRTAFALVLVLVVAIAILEPGTQSLPLSVDEVPWIVSAIYYTDLVNKGDFTSASWEGEDYGLWGSLNPHVGRWWIGIGLWLHPATRHVAFTPAQLPALMHRMPLGQQWSPDDPRGQIPYHVILQARRSHAVAGLIALTLLFFLVRDLCGLAAATGTALALAACSPFFETLARVYTDGLYLVLLLALTWCLIRAWRAAVTHNCIGWLVAAGACSGLAFNVKATGLVFGCGVILLCILGCRGWRVSRLGAVATAIGTAILFAVGANPYCWPTAAAPRHPDWRVLLPARFAGGQIARDPTHSTAPVWLRVPELHLRWRRQLMAQAALFPEQRASGATILTRILFSYQGHGAALVLLALAGAAWCIGGSHASTWSGGTRIVFLTAMMHVVWLVALRPLDWDRYYLPALAHMLVAESLIVQQGLMRLTSTGRPDRGAGDLTVSP